MPLLPPPHIKTKEAFFIYGQMASGKSTIWDSIAEAYRKTQTPGRFYVISTEPERAHVITERHLDGADNVVIFEPERTFEGLRSTCEMVHSLVDKETGQDWLIVDSLGACQEWVRDAWFEQPEHFGMKWKTFQEQGHSIREVQPHQWQQINSAYRAWIVEYVLGFPGHRIVVAQADTLAEGTWDQGEVRDTFGHVGWKPVCQKRDWYYFHSMWFANRTRDNKLTLRTLKDKPGRRWVDDEPVADLSVGGFALSYLRGVAGWSESE